jgi:hypothetical protein
MNGAQPVGWALCFARSFVPAEVSGSYASKMPVTHTQDLRTAKPAVSDADWEAGEVAATATRSLPSLLAR